MNGQKSHPGKITWFAVLIHILGLLPLLLLVIDYFTGNLSINPIQDIEQRLGRSALYLLTASLSVTPLAALTGWRWLRSHRRTLGLYTFLYVSLHFLTFSVLDYGLNVREIARLILEKPFILLGTLAGIIIFLLAITSFDFFVHKMGKSWQKLHRLIYLASLAVIIHYALAKKGDIFSLQGDILKPVLWGLLVILLLVLRIPWISRKVSSRRQSLQDGRSAIKRHRN